VWRALQRALRRAGDPLHVKTPLTFSDHDAPHARRAAQPGEAAGPSGKNKE